MKIKGKKDSETKIVVYFIDFSKKGTSSRQFNNNKKKIETEKHNIIDQYTCY